MPTHTGSRRSVASVVVPMVAIAQASIGDDLLDNGFMIGGGRTVNAGFTVCQPFDVDGRGWRISSIGVHAFQIAEGTGMGMLGDLLEADGF